MPLMSNFLSHRSLPVALGTALAATLLTAATAQAVTITPAGSDINLGSAWRTDTVAKNDFDGNNVLGTDGYRIVGNNARALSPVYLTNITQNPAIFGGNGGYASIDDPNTTPGGAPTLIGTGTTTPFPGTNNEASVFSFTVKAGAPSTFRLAVLVDNTDGTQFTSNALRVEQTFGGAANSGSVNTSTVNQVSDWYYFDIADAQAGDTFSVFSAGSASGCACVGGIAFDSGFTLNAANLWSVDIQPTGAPVMSGIEPNYGAGNVWNAFNIAPHPSAVVNPSLNLVSSDGAASPVTFTILGTVSAFNGGGPLTTDYLFIGAGNVPNVTGFDFEVTGLVAHGEYEMFLYGNSLDASRDLIMTLDLNGNGLLADETGLNMSVNGVLFASIFADENGRIFGNAFNAAGSEANWAGFQLRQIGAPVPEPATMSLLAFASVAMLRRRRAA